MQAKYDHTQTAHITNTGTMLCIVLYTYKEIFTSMMYHYNAKHKPSGVIVQKKPQKTLDLIMGYIVNNTIKY